MSSADLYKTLDDKKIQVLVDESQTKALLTSLLPPGDRKDIDEEVRKTFVLSKSKKKGPAQQASKKRGRKTHLTLRERRQAGLYQLPRSGLKFNDYIPLNQLWSDYMRSYLNLDEFKALSVGVEQSSLQLQKADYHGAMVTVSRSRCPSLVGQSGILLMDTRNTFKLISKDNKVRTIPKENSMFNIALDDIVFTIFGKHMQIRPIERSTKKVKVRLVSDL